MSHLLAHGLFFYLKTRIINVSAELPRDSSVRVEKLSHVDILV